MIITDLKVLCEDKDGEDEDLWFPFVLNTKFIVALKQFDFEPDKSVVYTTNGDFVVNESLSKLSELIEKDGNK